MVRLCVVEGCSAYASYNYQGEKRKYCFQHKKPQMVYQCRYKCQHDGCQKYPIYNVIGASPKYCSLHKTEDMVNVKDKRCEEPNCSSYALFNYEGKHRLYCSLHKKEGMVLLKKNKQCIFQECVSIPLYNFVGETQAMYCSNHKETGMINVLCKRCMFEGCFTKPCFNFKGETTGVFCSKHKQDGMVNVKCCCQHDDCSKQAYFNFQGETTGMYCSQHKQFGMVNVRKTICLYDGCPLEANFNFQGETKGMYCSQHKSNEMVNVCHKMCKLCPTYANPKYRGYCLRCFIYTYPNEPIIKNYKVKEQLVNDALINHFPNEFIYNKRVQGGCSNRVPDWFFDCLTHCVFVECDENQHNNYLCENKRIMELFIDVGNRPVVFIRFNPDKYTDKNGTSIPSSFKYHKSFQVPIIRDVDEWSKRLNELIETTQYSIKNIPEKEVSVINLFYDGY